MPHWMMKCQTDSQAESNLKVGDDDDFKPPLHMERRT
jgi:hypothetical protein